MIIAVDFDGTCVTHDYPKIGRSIGAEPILKDIEKVGHQLILWTMRSGRSLEEAVAWFKQNDIWLFGINSNPDQIRWTKSTKAYAHLYIDDAALGCPLINKGHSRPFVNWIAVQKMLIASGILQGGAGC